MWRVTTSQQFRSAYEGPFVGSTGAEYLSLRAEPVVRGGSATYVIRCTGSGMMDNPVIIHITEQLARAFQEVLTQQQQTLGPNAQVPIPPAGNPRQHSITTAFDVSELQGTPTQRGKTAVTRIINYMKEDLGEYSQYWLTILDACLAIH